MRLFKIFLTSMFLVLTISCSKDIERKISSLEGDQIELQMIETYRAGITEFEKKNYPDTIKV